MAVYVAAASLIAAAVEGGLSYAQSQSAANAQKNLADQQAAELQAQEEQAKAQALQQASTGQGFGQSTDQNALKTGFGFDGAPAASPNQGRGQITGLGAAF